MNTTGKIIVSIYFLATLLAVAFPAMALVPANQNPNPINIQNGKTGFNQYCNMNPWSCKPEEVKPLPPIVASPITLRPGNEWFCNSNPWVESCKPPVPATTSLAPIPEPTPVSKTELISQIKIKILQLQLQLLQLLVKQAQGL